MKVKVIIFLYVVFRYIYTQPQTTTNAIYNTQKYDYLLPYHDDDVVEVEQQMTWRAFTHTISFPSNFL